MDDYTAETRRALLATVGVAITGTAGCAGLRGTDTAATDTASPVRETAPTENRYSDLDHREANVVGVAFEPAEEGVISFDVTLLHDDEGEDGYANWWQVETIEGSRLGRRELRHAHGTQPFTRSTEISVPAEAECVVVRGHDQTHGYGGQAQLVNLESEHTRQVMQGSEPEEFEPGACP